MKEINQDDQVTISVGDFERNYVSRASFDALRDRVSELVEQADAAYAPYRVMVQEARAEMDKYATKYFNLQQLMGVKEDALASYADFYSKACGLAGLDPDCLPSHEVDTIILTKIAEHDYIKPLRDENARLRAALADLLGYVDAGDFRSNRLDDIRRNARRALDGDE